MAGTSPTTLYNNDCVWLSARIASVAATTSYWLVAPGAGEIRRMRVVIYGAISDDTTFGLELAGTNVTDGGSAAICTVESSGSAAGDVATGEADAANVVTNGQAVEITCGGEGSTAAIGEVFVEFVPA